MIMIVALSGATYLFISLSLSPPRLTPFPHASCSSHDRTNSLQ